MRDYWTEPGLTSKLFKGTPDTQRKLLSCLFKADADIDQTVPKSDLAKPRDAMSLMNNPLLVLLQSGVFTILDYKDETGACTVGYPNDLIKMETYKAIKEILQNKLGQGALLEEVVNALDMEDMKRFLSCMNKLPGNACDTAGLVQASKETAFYERTI